MPTHYSIALYRPAPSWSEIWDFMNQWLEPLPVELLQPLGFYKRYDLEVPPKGGDGQLERDEKAAIESCASQLTIAAPLLARCLPGHGSRMAAGDCPRRRVVSLQ